MLCEESKSLIMIIVQVVTIYNAINLGWKVRKIADRQYELSRIMCDDEIFNFENFVNQIVYS